MKKLTGLIISALAICSLAACGDAIEIPSESDINQGGKTEEPVKEGAFSGDISFAGTIADLPDGTKVSWETGDAVLISDGKVTRVSVNTAEAGQIALFPFTVTEGDNNFIAFYPAECTIDGSIITAGLPVAQTAAEDGTFDRTLALKAAKGSSSLLYFNTCISVVKFSLNMEGITKVVFKTAAGEKIAGDITVDLGENQTVEATSDEVVISGDFEKGRTYSIVTIPQEVSGYTIVASRGDVEVAHSSGGRISLVAGSSVTIPEIQEDCDIFRIVKMQIWGGTGPEYNCSKVYNMLAKPGCFDQTDGRGIEALKDNYLEFHHDGSFYNWAGVDGRNWWFVFAGTSNPATGKAVDLKAFYDLLPRDKGTFENGEGGVITFTKADGTTVTGQWVEPGTYPLPGTKPELSVTTENIAIMFQIKGGKDNWTYMWDDYGVMALRPRALFIELEKMPDGFLTPEESKTTDAEFEYVPPVDPGTQFDFASFEGNWNIFGGNSAPYGISVLGGSGDDPAFISPIDKSWNWDDSIWWESDNVLGIKLTGKTDTEVTGECNYWGGNDGKFWNYTWKSTGEDLSRFYGLLYHGKTTFTLNLKTLEVTFGNGSKAKFLTPGEHEFMHGKIYTVHDKCFAFSFHLMDDVDATSSRWTDIDRFVYAPHDYVMEFEKM